MKEFEATEQAYKNGYDQGVEDAAAKSRGTVLEKEIELKLKKMIERHGGLCLKWVCPGWLGVPDRLCLLPGGTVIFVETKRPRGGKLGAMQKWWARTLNKLGFLHLWVKCEDDIYAMEMVVMDLRGGR